MGDCALYSDPQLYDTLFPAAGESDAVPDDARRRRIVLSERFYLEEAVKGAGPVLEAACGSGRLAVPLARHGLEVTGLDLSGPMIAVARQKAADANVRLHLLEADMRSYALADRFATILIPGNSLLHLAGVEDLLACLRNARRHLLPNGRLIFDISNPDVADLARDPDERAAIFRFDDPTRGEVRVEETAEYDAAAQVRRFRWYFSASGAPDYRTLEYQLRVIFPQELLVLLDAAGLRLEKRFGEFSREEFTARSPRQVCICAATSS